MRCTCCDEYARNQCTDHDTGYGVCDRCFVKYGRSNFCLVKSCKAHDGLALAEPGRTNLIDTINPATGKTSICGETLEQVRARYPGAEIVHIAEWIKAKAIRQDEPVQWLETTEEEYNEMLEVLPPAAWLGSYFLVGEPMDHHAATGRPRYSAYGMTSNEKYIKSSRPMTIKELIDYRKVMP